ncbi:MAG: 7TM diverse intracellular signaling domain-containing protein [Bacteroidota bacterium]
MNELQRVCILLLVCFAWTGATLSAQALSVDTVGAFEPIYEEMYFLTDATGSLSNEEAFAQKESHRPPFQLDEVWQTDHTYWGLMRVENPQKTATQWIMYTPGPGRVEMFWQADSGQKVYLKGGVFFPAKEKARNDGPYVSLPLNLDAGESGWLQLRFTEVDGNQPNIRLTLYSLLSWQEQFPKWTFTERLSNFFQGVFLIMMLYNVVLFLTLRLRIYLYYALYLVCISLFVLFSVGPMSYPPFGDPMRLIPLGYLGLGAINIFYFLFGRKFVDLERLLPKWDRFLKWYVLARILSVVWSQVIIWTDFDLAMALKIEFALMVLDILISLVWFVALARTRTRLAWYLIAGSGSVIVIGLSLSVIGHLLAWRLNTYLIFLGSIVVEIVFFSLGLAYRIRRTEQAKADAEQEKRIAQEALNEELSKINTAFGRFVPHEFLRSLGHETILDVSLGDGVEKDVTVLFADIRAYTSISEQMTPKENFEFLNAYLGRVGPNIQENRGFVNQYYGDGIMALFLESPEDALKAALAILHTLRTYNAERRVKKRPIIQLGIGIHTGPLMMGVMGDTLRMEAGVVSDTVNTTSRLEGLTKFYGSRILFSETTLAGIPDPSTYHLRYLGLVQVKGRKGATKVYECFGGDEPDVMEKRQKSMRYFSEGLAAYYGQDFTKATHAFDAVLTIDPDDQSAHYYQRQSTQHLLSGVPENWNGVVEMVRK